MRTVIAAGLVAATQAAQADFPAFDSLHAKCQLTTTFPGTQCSELYFHFDTEVRRYGNGDAAGGVYTIFEQEPTNYVWSTRRTGGKGKYVDDQIFSLTQKGSDCEVEGKSRSQSMSYYDYDTNFCNLWNVYNAVGGMGEVSRENCKFFPTKPEETCKMY